jgi:hypothetical protein
VGYRLSSRRSGISRVLEALFHHKLVVAFVSLHLLLAIFLGRLFALAPDEGGYLYTFDNLYRSKDANPQFSSGWIVAPKPFLWVTYLPAKILNILGMPDYLSVRMLSIAIVTLSLVLLLNLQRRTGKSTSRRERMIFLFFFVPSVFLWTTVGLREVFILAELSLIFVGLNYLFQNNSGRAFIFISLGSYALLSTKNYIWICLVLSSIVLTLILGFRGVAKKKLMNLGIALVLIPCIAFASTTSVYALKFLITSVFHTDLTATGARSGDSITQVAISNSAGGSDSGAGSDSGSDSGSIFNSSKSKGSRIITFHGDSTLIYLHFYLIDHPKAIFSRVANALGIAKKVQEIWAAKIKSGLVKKTGKVLPDSSSLNGHILKPGKLHNPASIVIPALRFMFGPVPFLIHGGIALNAVAFESPLWWLLYSIVLFRLIRYRKNRYWQDPLFLLSATYFLSLVAISALVEVNLGTSFRHRSILFIPLLVMYLRSRRTLDAVVD